MVVSAVIWGSASVFLYPSGHPLYESFFIIIMAGMSAGGVGTLSSIRYASQTYSLILIVPLIVAIISQPNPLYFYLAFTVVVYLIVIWTVATRIYDSIASALKFGMLHEAALADLKLSEERFETIFKEAPAGIFYYDADFVVVETNDEMLKILHIDRDRMIGLDLKKLPDSCLDEALIAPTQGIKGYYEGPYTTMVNRIDLWITLQTTPVFDAERNVVGGVGIVADITERIASEEKMKHQAYYDALTNIPNRFLLRDRIEQSLAHYRRHKTCIAVLFLDLDHFKSINDSLGHHIGDALLIETATRLKTVCRQEDTVARLGGDEFVVLLTELGSEQHLAATKAETVAEKIHQVLSEPFFLQNNIPLTISSSIGVAIIGDEAETADDLLKFADTAMYEAKKEGRNTTRFYQEQMDQWIKKRLMMENALRNAIKNRELQLYYQPVIEIGSKKIIGAEALVRWHHPDMGMVMPDEMISIAEESKLILPIGEWIMEEACRQFVEWKKSHPLGAQLNRIAVNVSAIQFRQNDFVEKVVGIVNRTGIEPSMLEIELTESIIIDRFETIVTTMEALKEFGISISMDDFGTGYSSLAYLKRLPFSTLKIDRSFVRDVMQDKDDAALIETIVSMASAFKLDVIAEGVETRDQLTFLEKLGCRFFQGYLCSPPLPPVEYGEFLFQNVNSCPSFLSKEIIG